MLELRRAGLDDVEVLVGLLRETLIQAYQDVHSAENLQAYCEENYTVAIATAEVPFTALALRVLKSDALVGIDPSIAQKAATEFNDWRTRGHFAVVQSL